MRSHMHLRRIILKAVQPPCGHATRNVLYGLCRGEIDRREFDATMRELLASGALRKFGGRKDAVYGVPRKRG